MNIAGATFCDDCKGRIADGAWREARVVAGVRDAHRCRDCHDQERAHETRTIASVDASHCAHCCDRIAFDYDPEHVECVACGDAWHVHCFEDFGRESVCRKGGSNHG